MMASEILMEMIRENTVLWDNAWHHVLDHILYEITHISNNPLKYTCNSHSNPTEILGFISSVYICFMDLIHNPEVQVLSCNNVLVLQNMFFFHFHEAQFAVKMFEICTEG
jgi:hypothetical protein